jgi:hypothetical protein
MASEVETAFVPRESSARATLGGSSVVRKLLIALASLCCLSTVAQAQEWAIKMFESTRHDFGAVARGAKAAHEFPLSNIYLEDVHIASVRSSCGCTTPQVTQELLKTYEKGAIVASLNTRAFLGQKHATLTVTFDKPFYAEVQLNVAGYIRSDVVLEPGSVDFGTVDHGTKVEKQIDINYAGRGDWQILAIKSSSVHVEAEAVETSRSAGQVSYRLVARLLPDAPQGYINQQLVLVTNDQQASEFSLDVNGRVASSISISPSSLFMGSLKPGQQVTKQLVVHGKKPFKIVAVQCDEKCLTIATPPDAKSVHQVPVTFVAGDKPGKITYKIRIETDLGEGAASELTAYAEVIDAKAE